MKILLVDDDAFLRDMYATKFGEKGHEVQAAKSGEIALEFIQKEQFDVVLLDMIMPGISGIDLINAIKKSKGEDAPKCIVLTNDGDDATTAAAKAAGAVGYIIKAELIPSEVVGEVEKLVS